MDRIEKHLRKIPGVDFYPLAYLLRDTATTPVTAVDLLTGKCYSVTYNSMIEEYVELSLILTPVVKQTKLLCMDASKRHSPVTFEIGSTASRRHQG